MAFVYNNKLPFHSWGVFSGSTGITGPGYFLQNSIGCLSPPISEEGAVPQYRNTRYGSGSIGEIESYRAPVNGSPCDAQLPICRVVSAGGAQANFLTIHGEIYLAEANAYHWIFGPSGTFAEYGRRLAKLNSSLVQVPFSNLCLGTQEWLDTDGTYYKNIAITTNGKAYWISTLKFSQGRFLPYPELLEIQLPNAEQAQSLWNLNGTLILTTRTNKTYTRYRTELTWYALTTGCVDVDWGALEAGRQDVYWTGASQPTVSVESAPSGGETATVEGVWYQQFGYWYLDNLKITNPGRGYTSNPVVSFDRAPFGNPSYSISPPVKLTVFQDCVITIPSRTPLPYLNVVGPFVIGNTGKMYELAIRPAVQAAGNSFAYPWVFAIKAELGSPSVEVFAKELVRSTSQTDANVAFISPSGALYTAKLERTTSSSVRSTITNVSLIDSGSWSSIASAENVLCAVKSDGSMWTWGKNGTPGSLAGVLFGDGSAIGAIRSTPSRITPQADWLNVFSFGSGFVAVRRDAVSRSIDQPMEYWPEWYYQ